MIPKHVLEHIEKQSEQQQWKVPVTAWQSIATYDQLKTKPPLAVFRFKPVTKDEATHPSNVQSEMFSLNRVCGYRDATHWMPLPKPPTD
jgi:hypothetical protein